MTARHQATKGQAPKTRRQPAVKPDPGTDHPDPVTLCEPTFDDAGLLRWGSTKY